MQDHAHHPDTSAALTDPDRDSAATVVAFFERLAADLTSRGVDASGDLLGRIRARQAELQASALDVPDAAARYNLRYTSAVLAAYEMLSAVPADTGLPTGSALIDWLTAAFVEPFAGPVAEGTRALLDAAPDPFAAMVEVARAREERDFGAQFVFEHPVDNADRFHADVHRCGYHTYLSAHGAPELTRVLCAFDANWSNAIDPDRHGVSFTRETTIGTGGPICPFHFERTQPAAPTLLPKGASGPDTVKHRPNQPSPTLRCSDSCGSSKPMGGIASSGAKPLSALDPTST